MKFLVVFAIIAFVAGTFAVTDEQKQKAEGYVKDCIQEGGVDPAEVAKLKKGDFSNKDEKVQCFAKCFFTKAGFMDADGKFNEEVAKEKLSQGAGGENAGKLVDACKNEKGANSCETAFKIYECYYKNKVVL